MNYLPEFLVLALAHFLAVLSPGPDFIMVSRNSLVYSRRSGIFSAIGLGLGILVHVSYTLLGLGLIISQSIIAFSILKFLGASYLIYIGYKALRSKAPKEIEINLESKKDLSTLQALRMGFITNATNPKATLFFLSIFTVIVSPTTPLFVKGLYGIEMAVVTMLWFSMVAVLFSQSFLKKRVGKIQHRIEKVMGGILILLGVKLALSSNK